jgi:hypothetical protein
MTTEQGFRLVTRALTVFSLFWVVSEILYFPADVIGVAHHLQLLRMAREMDKYVAEETYWVRYYAELVCMRIIMVTLSLWMALIFYQGGPRLRRFFLIDPASSSVEATTAE